MARVRYEIIDGNFIGTKRTPDGVIATTGFADVAEIMAQAYTQARYGGRFERGTLQDMRPISVRDTSTGEEILSYGLVTRKQIGRIENG